MSTNSNRTSKVQIDDQMHQKTNKCEAENPRLFGEIKSGNKGVQSFEGTQYSVEMSEKDSDVEDAVSYDEQNGSIEEVDEIETAELEDSTAGVDSNQTPQNDESAETGFVMLQSSLYITIFYI